MQPPPRISNEYWRTTDALAKNNIFSAWVVRRPCVTETYGQKKIKNAGTERSAHLARF